MYSSFGLARKYIRYYLTASNSRGHGMHSPFVFDFIQSVLNNKKNYLPPAAVEDVRRELLKDHEVLEIEDFGAGSRQGPSSKKKVSRIAAAALKPKKYAQVLYRLVRHYQPQTIIELGTSLGLTTSYLALANKGATVSTIEGSKAIAKKAASHFQKLGIKNIEILTGNFNALLPGIISRVSSIDLAYVDGNHRYGPTIDYFLQLLSKSGSHTILVFDDIHWSSEMEKAWEEIKTHPSVRYTIDIFFLGFVFFRDEFKEKQHFTIRF